MDEKEAVIVYYDHDTIHNTVVPQIYSIRLRCG